jgi:hypothetical protein
MQITPRSAQIRKRITSMSPLQNNNVGDTDNQEEKKKKLSAVGLTSANAEAIKRVVKLEQEK